MEKKEREEEIKNLVEFVWTAPIQEVLSIENMVRFYPIMLTKIKLHNAITARRHAEFCRALDEKKKKKEANKSSFWNFFKFWDRKAD